MNFVNTATKVRWRTAGRVGVESNAAAAGAATGSIAAAVVAGVSWQRCRRWRMRRC